MSLPRYTPLRSGKPPKNRKPMKAGDPSTRLRSPKALRRTAIRPRAPGGVKRMKHRRVPAFLAWIRAEPCAMSGHASHVCGFTGRRPRIEAAHVRTRGAGHPDLFDVIPACPALHDATEAGKRPAWERTFGVSLVALARGYTLRFVAETGFDLDAYLAGLDANPKHAAYAAELRGYLNPNARAQ